MKNAIATSKTSGSKFDFQYDVFSEGRQSIHSGKIFIDGAWRSADTMVMGEELHGACQWISGGQRCDVKFIVSETEDTKRMVEYAKQDAAEYAAEKAAKREAAANQETFLN